MAKWKVIKTANVYEKDASEYGYGGGVAGGIAATFNKGEVVSGTLKDTDSGKKVHVKRNTYVYHVPLSILEKVDPVTGQFSVNTKTMIILGAIIALVYYFVNK